MTFHNRPHWRLVGVSVMDVKIHYRFEYPPSTSNRGQLHVLTSEFCFKGQGYLVWVLATKNTSDSSSRIVCKIGKTTEGSVWYIKESKTQQLGAR